MEVGDKFGRIWGGEVRFIEDGGDVLFVAEGGDILGGVGSDIVVAQVLYVQLFRTGVEAPSGVPGKLFLGDWGEALMGEFNDGGLMGELERAVVLKGANGEFLEGLLGGEEGGVLGEVFGEFCTELKSSIGAKLNWFGRPYCDLGPRIFAFIGRTSGRTIWAFLISSFSSLCKSMLGLVGLSFIDALLKMLVLFLMMVLSLLDLFKGHMVSLE